MSDAQNDAGSHPLSYRFLAGIWAALLALTALTISVARVDLGFFNVVVALGIASLKSALVIFFFMHLKYENRTIKTMVLVAFVVLAICIGLTFSDVGFRR
ncbi:cytochrome C oxidase subunit IV family protein [Fundidesulfovibrio soli]|uniref:cytochrome C oxidase subunit IV family protein n=1 Tax=Fundidesulfovibrio soli TaxID=2922716 RepID=UPI001FAF8A75|nr:cytochrome C oxidase subunit IV family protein [Fundidesulfovibrio soli]